MDGTLSVDGVKAVVQAREGGSGRNPPESRVGPVPVFAAYELSSRSFCSGSDDMVSLMQ